ncbi:MAG: M43 family zinc metalloprotease [Bacteroidales bacterium]
MIRYLYIILVFIITSSGTLLAQNQEEDFRCSSEKYNKDLEEKYPWIKENRSRIEKEIQEFINNHSSANKTIITIPTVVHVLWNTPEQNIPDDQIWSQIFVLNDDFRRRNADTIHTPAMFKPVAADCQIEFCLAKRAPGDTAGTYGIVRKYTTVEQFGIDNQVKNPYEGGSRAWDPEKYLNIWVCNLAGNFLGYAQYPGGTDSTDGVVIDYKCFGSVGDLNPHYNKGRTATHEIGHWLDLWHIWGDDYGSCEGTDYVDDTPNAANANYYCPAHPHTSNCNSTGEMFMNYMDYCDDICFNLFTAGQRDRMIAAVNAARPGLLNSDGCVPYDAIPETGTTININLFPNPVNQAFTLKISMDRAHSVKVYMTDITGKELYRKEAGINNEFILPVDVSGIQPGLYFINVMADGISKTMKLTVLH